MTEVINLSVAQLTMRPVALNQMNYFAEQTNVVPMLESRGYDKLVVASLYPFLFTFL